MTFAKYCADQASTAIVQRAPRKVLHSCGHYGHETPSEGPQSERPKPNCMRYSFPSFTASSSASASPFFHGPRVGGLGTTPQELTNAFRPTCRVSWRRGPSGAATTRDGGHRANQPETGPEPNPNSIPPFHADSHSRAELVAQSLPSDHWQFS